MPTLSAQNQLMNIKEASFWATSFLKRTVSEANISYYSLILQPYGIMEPTKADCENDGNERTGRK